MICKNCNTRMQEATDKYALTLIGGSPGNVDFKIGSGMIVKAFVCPGCGSIELSLATEFLGK